MRASRENASKTTFWIRYFHFRQSLYAANTIFLKVTKSVEKSVENGGWGEYVTEVMSYSKYKKDTQQFAGIFMSSDYYMSTIFVLVDKTNDERAPLKITNFFSKEVLSYDTQKGRYSFLVTSLQSLVDASKQSSLNVRKKKTLLDTCLPITMFFIRLSAKYWSSHFLFRY